MKSSKIIAVIVAVIAVVWVVSGVFMPSSDAKAPVVKIAHEDAAKIPAVQVREIIAQDFEDNVIVTGRSRASRRVEMKAETSGQLEKILKEEGELASKGDVLAQLEIKDRAAKLREAQQRLNQRQIEYNAAKQLEGKGFNSKVKLAQTQADLEDAKARLTEAQIELEKIKITAPFDGVVTAQTVEAGDYLNKGDPLFTLVDLDPVEFVGYVSERRIHDVALGKKAQVEFLNGESLVGEVSYIAPAANTQTRTFEVVISAPNADLDIKEGLTAKVYIPAATRKAYRISPSILALNDAGRIGVKIVDEQDRARFVPVVILADQSDAMWITGLPDTARIITVGQDFVSEGQHVNPVLSKEEGRL